MEEKGFFQTRAGRLTIAFCIIMVAFALMLNGLRLNNDILCLVGFLLTAGALLNRENRGKSGTLETVHSYTWRWMYQTSFHKGSKGGSRVSEKPDDRSGTGSP